MNDTATTEKWLDRVQSLLAKAEATTFPEEAEAFYAKAQEIIAAHGIDEALLAAKAGGAVEDVIWEVVYAEAPYASAKTVLWNVIAKANNCEMVLFGGGKRKAMRIYGFPSDIGATKALYASLSVYASRAMMAADVPPWDTPRAFRHAFMLSFASRIGRRLEEANASAVTEHVERTGESVGLVLVERREQVSTALAVDFPRLSTRRTSASSSAGAGAGRSAADRASIGQRSVSVGGRRALGA